MSGYQDRGRPPELQLFGLILGLDPLIADLGIEVEVAPCVPLGQLIRCESDPSSVWILTLLVRDPLRESRLTRTLGLRTKARGQDQ